MTVHELIQPMSNLDQLEVLQRADRLFASRESESRWQPHMALNGQLFPDRGGRYYGGQLTDAEIETLTYWRRPKRERVCP